MGETLWKDPRHRYENDIAFKTLVDTMVHGIVACQYTPSEMREAAVLASTIYEEVRTKRMFAFPSVDEKGG